MIRSFANTEAEELFETGQSRRWREIERVAFRKLRMLAAAPNLGALASIPGNRLEPLKTGCKGQYSIRINLKYRVCFRWELDGAYDVEITDYHRR
jgi:proteic killer suppression protein